MQLEYAVLAQLLAEFGRRVYCVDDLFPFGCFTES